MAEKIPAGIKLVILTVVCFTLTGLFGAWHHYAPSKVVSAIAGFLALSSATLVASWVMVVSAILIFGAEKSTTDAHPRTNPKP